MAPHSGMPQPDTSTQMQCDNDQEGLPEERDPKDGRESLGTGGCTDGVHQGDHTYANLAAEMTGEPLPSGTCLCTPKDYPDGIPPAIQFLQMALFPATYEKVQTAFTFKVLKLAQLHRFSGKESVWDFYTVMRRWTNNVDPKMVPDLYPQFRKVLQLWGTIRLVKRSGYLELAVERGGLVVRCPTCPRPGMNIPDNWKDDPLARLKYSSMMSIDGNFHLQRNHKGVRKDFPLTGNAGFWVDDGELMDYTDGKGAKVEEHERAARSSCHSFKAGDPSRLIQKSGKAVLGVVMVSCARHSFIQPNGTVDLDKGERFAYVDVALASVLQQQDPQQRHLHTYDIGCKYGIHFKERVTKSVLGTQVDIEAAERGSMPRDVLISPSDFPKDFDIKVPSWHVLGHILPCILANSLRYTPLVGRTSGEGVETIWAIMNAHQYSTREMTHGHRRDCLTDIFNDYNWVKLCSESRRVSDAYFVACQMLLTKSVDLEEIEEDIGAEKLAVLEAESASRGQEQYGAQVIQEPSKSKVLIALKNAEDEEFVNATNAGCPPGWSNDQPSGALLLSNALELEDLQYQLRTRSLSDYVTEGTIGSDKRRVQHLRSMDTLRKRCGEHLSALAVLCPDIPEAALVRSQNPTEQDLYLPSSFSKPLRQEYRLTVLARKEGELRIGNAHDHLAALKDALGLQRMLVQAKRAHVRGNEGKTRAETTVKRAGEVIKRHKEGYRRNWTLMGKLGVDLTGDNSPAKGLKELKDGDVKSLREFTDSDTYSGSLGELPWIWRTVGTVLPHGAGTTDVKQAVRDWEQEVLRLTWVHARSARDRWWEEQALLYEELRRVVATFERLELLWRGRQPSVTLTKPARSGFRAYCLKTAAVFGTLAKEARIKLSSVQAHQNCEPKALTAEPLSAPGLRSDDAELLGVIGMDVGEM
ncbi:hypothetical protein FS837_002783 [Tulasnella sp. UAMH 9824]|nr:hypothetical protein FS837_002783 [Tulasnella sp. UAMH 9824]